MIGRLFLASVAAGAFACGAAAADLPVAPGPSYYPAVVTPSPYYNWGGIYIGGNAGGAWAAQNGGVITDVPTGAIIANTSSQSKGFAGGGQVGGNWFFAPSYVLGLEADFDALTNKSSVISTDGSTQHVGKLEFLSTARGRFGLTADRFMIYATGGFAWAKAEMTRTQITGAVNNAGTGTVETIDKNRFGWVAGAGMEYAFAHAWTARMEYLYTQLDGVTYTFPLAMRSTATAFQGISELRIGVNYKFDLGGGPISARD